MIQHSFTSGGFPLTVEHLESIEEQIRHLSAFAKLFFNAEQEATTYVPSNFFVIEDGEFTGNNNGFVLYRGEVFYVEAATYGSPSATVGFIVDTQTESKVYADNTTVSYRTIRSAHFATSYSVTPDSTLNAATINQNLLTALTNLTRQTVGGTARPIYLNNGVPTPCSDTVGSGKKPVYMDAGTIKESDSTVGSSAKPVYLDNGELKAVTHEINKTVPSDAEFTDTKVTAVGNHYTPATNAASALSASASGATAAWSIDVVKGVTISRDAKGHVTGVSVTSGKIPANPDTGATSVEVTGSGNAVTAASYSASTRKMTLTKGTTFLTSHQSLAAYTPTANLPSVGILHIINFQTTSVSYVHLMGPSNSLLSSDYSNSQVNLQFNLSKRYLLIPMAHGYAQGGTASMSQGCVAGYSGNTNSAYSSTGDGSWTASKYATLRLSNATWYTVLVIGY